jgi:hypothetical protein
VWFCWRGRGVIALAESDCAFNATGSHGGSRSCLVFPSLSLPTPAKEASPSAASGFARNVRCMNFNSLVPRFIHACLHHAVGEFTCLPYATNYSLLTHMHPYLYLAPPHIQYTLNSHQPPRTLSPRHNFYQTKPHQPATRTRDNASHPHPTSIPPPRRRSQTSRPRCGKQSGTGHACAAAVPTTPRRSTAHNARSRRSRDASGSDKRPPPRGTEFRGAGGPLWYVLSGDYGGGSGVGFRGWTTVRRRLCFDVGSST